MAHKKKPVDDTPICDLAYARRIDPLWMPGRVPLRFWEDETHRRDYLLWLAYRLGFRSMEDFYGLKLTEACRRNYGRTLLSYWGDSAFKALQECFPEYDWKAWLFTQVPNGFWDAIANRRSYLHWLGKELGFRRPEDWYGIRAKEIIGRHGSALRGRFSSFYDLMREFLPQLDWDRIDEHQPIRVEEILAWADAHHAEHGRWPTCKSGEISGTGHTWLALDMALRSGFRGLPGRTSLSKLLEQHRGVRVGRTPPRLSEKQILAWADAYFAAQGKWPGEDSGPIPGSRETWVAVASALRAGRRGFRGGSSLAQLLAQRRGVRNRRRLPPLKEKQILAWADAYFAAQGKWPTRESGPIPGAGETWSDIASALNLGYRGLPGGSSLAQLLALRRGVRNRKRLPPLKEKQILAWADTYFAAQGKWPTQDSGPIPGTGEIWSAVATAMQQGCRGFRRGLSLAQLLAQRRGVRNRKRLPPLPEAQIVEWARAHFEATGRWPNRDSGPIAQSPGDTWSAVHQALTRGLRGLPAGASLAKLLRKHGLK